MNITIYFTSSIEMMDSWNSWTHLAHDNDRIRNFQNNPDFRYRKSFMVMKHLTINIYDKS